MKENDVYPFKCNGPSFCWNYPPHLVKINFGDLLFYIDESRVFCSKRRNLEC